MKRLLVGLMAVAALLASVSFQAPVWADSQVSSIFEKVKALNPGMQDYSAAIDIAVQARVSFLPYNPKMAGRYYHKRPDKHKLVLEKAPSYVKKYPNIFGWNLPKLEKFNSKVAEETTLDGQPVWRIELTPKQGMGDIQRVDVWVNRSDYTIPRQVTYYKNDGLLGVDVEYTTSNGYKVFDKMVATFKFPKASVSATATATYSDYQFNQNLADSFFTSKK